jgi:hypothetical protein
MLGVVSIVQRLFFNITSRNETIQTFSGCSPAGPVSSLVVSAVVYLLDPYTATNFESKFLIFSSSPLRVKF